MAKFQTYFGIAIPEWKEEKIGPGGCSIRFVITGTITSKKNNELAVTVRKEAKEYIKGVSEATGRITLDDALRAIDMVKAKMRGNKEYSEFVKEMRPVIESQKSEWIKRLGSKGLVFPLSKATMTLKLYFKGRYITDTVNKQQTIQDLLKECGVIQDDDYRRLNPIHAASACYYQELSKSIAFITLSFKMKQSKNEQ